MTHADFVDQLGGPAFLADHFGLTVAAVSYWKTRGVAWEYRPALAQMAETKGVPLPDGFLTPKKRKRAA